MAIRDGPNGIEVNRGNGWERGNPTEASMELDNEPVYAYDQKEGLLKVNERFMPGALEKITKLIDLSKSKEAHVTMMDPFEGRPQTLFGVKTVRYFTDGEKAMYGPVENRPLIPLKRSPFQKVKEKFYEITGW